MWPIAFHGLPLLTLTTYEEETIFLFVFSKKYVDKTPANLGHVAGGSAMKISTLTWAMWLELKGRAIHQMSRMRRAEKYQRGRF